MYPKIIFNHQATPVHFSLEDLLYYSLNCRYIWGVNCCERARADTTNEKGSTSFSMAYLVGGRAIFRQGEGLKECNWS